MYGSRQVFHDGVVPWRLLHSSPHFHRAADGIPARVRVHVAGIDIIRDEYGDFRVLEDNVLEYWTGEWTALDPTNRTEVGEGHVVARGRDYSDVPPLKGVYQGPPAENQEVTVEATRLA